MPCFNSGLYVSKTIETILHQTYLDWELKIINDGSSDNTLSILEEISRKDKRIKVFNKENGGYVSARKFGLQFICDTSEYIHFMDSDDLLEKGFYMELISILEDDKDIGAIFSDHVLIDSYDNVIGVPAYGQRYYPTRFWLKKIKDTNPNMPFCSIFSWSKMVEPMVVMRKSVYNGSCGWDDRFGLGKGNIGEGVLLFCEFALNSKIYFLNKQLYFYRKHAEQSTSNAFLNKMAVDKVNIIWKEKIVHGLINIDEYNFMLLFLKRLELIQILGSFRYNLKFRPIIAIRDLISFVIIYLKTYKLIFFGTKKINRLISG